MYATLVRQVWEYFFAEMKRKTETIMYRANRHHAEKLAERALRFGMSRGEYARVLVDSMLTERNAEELRHEMSEIKKHLEASREDTINLFAVLFSNLFEMKREEIMTLLKGSFDSSAVIAGTTN